MEVTIEAAEKGKSKGRSFSFELVAYVSIPYFEHHESNHRPIYMVGAMTDASLAPVRANLMMGRRFGVASHGSFYPSFELLKSRPYVFEVQRYPEGSFLTAYLPQPLLPDPGFVDPDTIAFAMIPQQTWAAEMRAKLGEAEIQRAIRHVETVLPKDEHFSRDRGDTNLEELVSIAPLFATYLDHRTRVPLVPDVRFYAQLLVRLLRDGAAYRTPRDSFGHSRVKTYGLPAVGLLEPVFMACNHTDFDVIAAEESARFLRATERTA